MDILEKSTKYHEAVLKSSQKVGIPKTRADIQTHNLAKTALLRNAANAATLNMAAIAMFDIKTLFNGDFQKYFVKLGISGMHGGAVAGIQARIHHSFFGNGAEVGVVVSSAFGVVGLVNTGDWARFGKNTGLGIVGSAGGWGGSKLVEHIYDNVKEGNAKMGLRVDPSLTKREVVARILDQRGDSVAVQMTDTMATDIATLQENLSDWQQGDPKDFEAFVEGLRKATSI
ncbi:hypothetical protein QX201_004132 [Fusarium graminearum]